MQCTDHIRLSLPIFVCFLRRVFLWTSSSLTELEWLAAQGSCLKLLRAGITDMCCSPEFKFWRSGLGFSGLYKPVYHLSLLFRPILFCFVLFCFMRLCAVPPAWDVQRGWPCEFWAYLSCVAKFCLKQTKNQKFILTHAPRKFMFTCQFLEVFDTHLKDI